MRKYIRKEAENVEVGDVLFFGDDSPYTVREIEYDRDECGNYIVRMIFVGVNAGQPYTYMSTDMMEVKI